VHHNAEKIKNDEYRVSMHVKDNHAFASLVKYSPEHRPVTFLMNSWDGYHSYLEHRFNLYKTEKEKLPFVEASFHVQHDKGYPEDNNCSLYTSEFTKAAALYLCNNDTSELHKACVEGDHTQAVTILHNGVKPYLPYYECSADGMCKKKSVEDIQKFHIGLRWLISGKVLWRTLKDIAFTSKLKTIITTKSCDSKVTS
jgi:hypothetical protein